ncbi:MAG: N-acetyltransferase [Leptolyngbya sp. SIO1E4]|nr:N-acetyltransferase [Leptolyngbya sp. SIO1E4]
MPNATIRSATVQDLKSILSIYNEAILNTTAVYDYEPHTLAMRQGWFEAKQADRFPVLVAELNREVVGFGSLGWFRAWAAYRYTVENSIYVAPHRRGQGIGKQLLAGLIESARAMELHAIVAGIDADNTVSCRLHEQFGFQEVAHLYQVGYKFGRWLDLKFLELLLETPTQPNESKRI